MSSVFCQALGRGVTRSKGLCMYWRRKAAENGNTAMCLTLAKNMYEYRPNARKVGHVVDAAVNATTVGSMEGGHDVPGDVLISVVHWLQKGGHNVAGGLNGFRRVALEGSGYCYNDGCEIVGWGLHSSTSLLILSRFGQ